MQGAWRDALFKGVEMDLPQSWIEPARSDPAPGQADPAPVQQHMTAAMQNAMQYHHGLILGRGGYFQPDQPFPPFAHPSAGSIPQSHPSLGYSPVGINHEEASTDGEDEQPILALSTMGSSITASQDQGTIHTAMTAAGSSVIRSSSQRVVASRLPRLRSAVVTPHTLTQRREQVRRVTRQCYTSTSIAQSSLSPDLFAKAPNARLDAITEAQRSRTDHLYIPTDGPPSPSAPSHALSTSFLTTSTSSIPTVPPPNTP